MQDEKQKLLTNTCLSAKRGGMTVFTAVLMPVLILLSLLLSDIYMAQAAKRIAKMQLDAATHCVLSNFNKYMYEEYSLYGYNMSSMQVQEVINETLLYSLPFEKPFALSIQGIEVQRVQPIQDPDVFMQQVQLVMSDDIFIPLIETANERIAFFSSLSDALEILRMKMNIDQIMDGVRQAHDMLKQLSGIINDNEYFLDLLEIAKDISLLQKQLRSLLDSQDEQDIAKRDVLTKRIQDIVNMQFMELMQVLKQANLDALSCMSEMTEAFLQMNSISLRMKDKVANMQDCPVYMQSILDLCVQSIETLELSLHASVYEILEKVLNDNIACMEQMGQDVLINLMQNSDVSVLDIVDRNMQKYLDLVYEDSYLDDFFHLVVDNAATDLRSKWKQIAQDHLSALNLQDAYIEDLMITLIEADDEYVFTADTSGSSLFKILQSFSQSEKLLKDFQQSVLLNEYVLLNLSNYVKSSKYEPSTYLAAETEYVVFGGRDNSKNLNSVKAAILSLRFAANTLHVYTDMEKHAKADALAIPLASLWSFGAAVPIAKNLIMCSWSYAESCYDTRLLYDGALCPLYKLKGDWVLDIGVSSGLEGTPKLMQLDYEDYLRLLLCFTSEQKKVQRILNVISINSPQILDMQNVYCGLDVKLVLKYRGLLGIVREFEVFSHAQY